MENLMCNKCGSLIDEESLIDYSDIPQISNFSNPRKNPHAARRKNGYTIIIEREGYNEIRKYDFTKIPRPSNGGDPVPVEVIIEKVH